MNSLRLFLGKNVMLDNHNKGDVMVPHELHILLWEHDSPKHDSLFSLKCRSQFSL